MNPIRIAVLLLMFVIGPLVVVTDGEDSPRTRAEQMEYDPQTGQWREIPPPVPGTPEGDLAIARRLLADASDYLTSGQPSLAKKAFHQARSSLTKWLKDYGSGHALSRAASLSLAAAEVGCGRYYEAHLILKDLIAEVGTDEVTQQAAAMDFLVAERFLSGTKRWWLGFIPLPEQDLGVEMLDKIGGDFPGTSIGENALKTKADYYYDGGEFDLAEDEYGRLIQEYPRSRYLLLSSFRRAQSAMAQFPGTKYDEAPLVESEERFLQFRQQFPDAAEQQQVNVILEEIRSTRAQKEFEIGQYYARVHRPGASRFYYRSVMENWPGTLAATRAEHELQKSTPPAPSGVSEHSGEKTP